MEKNNENAIEFITGDKLCTVSLTNQKYCNRIRKLYEKNADEFEWFDVNPDGSVYARIPLKWIRISPPNQKQLTEEQREELRQRMASVRESKKS